MSKNKNTPEEIFEDFLEGLIALDEEEKKPENLPPQYRNDPTFEGGIHFWQLQQYIVELAYEIMEFEAQFDELNELWATHSEYLRRYLGTVAIQYAKCHRRSPLRRRRIFNGLVFQRKKRGRE